MVEITTHRCLLRPMDESDFPALCRYLQDAEVMRAWGHAFSDGEVRDWIARQQARYTTPGFGALAIVLRATGELIGQCGLTMQSCQAVNSLLSVAAGFAPTATGPLPGFLRESGPRDLCVPEVGYMLARRHWGKGYATEAARACLRFGFGSLRLPEIFACIKVGNTASRAVAQRLKMRKCGSYHKEYRGEQMAHELFVLCAADFVQRVEREEEYALAWRC